MKLLAVLFAASLLLRLIALWTVPEPVLSTNASIAFLGGAHLLVEGKGFSDPAYPIFTPPLYAMFIALCSVYFGDDQMPVKIAQTIADSLTVIVLYFILLEVFTEKVALLSCALWAIYPFAIYPTLYIGSETFFTFFLSVFALLIIYAIKNQKLRYYCGAGILLGLATLTRGATLFFPLVFPFLLFVYHKHVNRVALNSLVFCLSFASVILPWTIRNYIVLGEFIPVQTAGEAVLQGSSEKFFTIDGKAKEYPKYFEMLRAKGIEPPPNGSLYPEFDKFLIRAGIENYKSRLQNDPLSFIPLLLKKFFRLWYATESGHNQGIILAVNMLIYLFGLSGIILALVKTKQFAWLLASIMVYFVVLHWLTHPLFRYMIPIMPYAIAFGGFAFIEITKNLKVCNLRSHGNEDDLQSRTVN